MSTVDYIIILIIIGILVFVFVPIIIMLAGSFIGIVSLPITAPFLLSKFTYELFIMTEHKGLSVFMGLFVFCLSISLEGYLIWLVYKWVI